MKLWKTIAAIGIVACLLMSMAACAETEPTDEPTDATTTAGDAATTTTVKKETPKITFRDTTENGGTIGSWWWNAGQMRSSGQASKYLTFLQDNQVTEVYASVGGLKESKRKEFIKLAATFGVRVAWLDGDASWVTSKSYNVVDNYLAYQAAAADDEKCYALHLDVEPHQLAEFKSDRAATMQLYAEFVGEVARRLHAAGEKIEWDIPFWLNDTVVMDGEEIELLDYVAKVSDTITIMSYRDTARTILDVSKEEIEVAKKYGCKVICGVETRSSEGDQVSFMEEGKKEMYKQLEVVYQTLGEQELPAYGITIHHVDQWYKLKDR